MIELRFEPEVAWELATKEEQAAAGRLALMTAGARERFGRKPAGPEEPEARELLRVFSENGRFWRLRRAESGCLYRGALPESWDSFEASSQKEIAVAGLCLAAVWAEYEIWHQLWEREAKALMDVGVLLMAGRFLAMSLTDLPEPGRSILANLLRDPPKRRAAAGFASPGAAGAMYQPAGLADWIDSKLGL